MNEAAFQSIVHPTDLSEMSEVAFAHALRLALAARSALHILHIEKEKREGDWDHFPDVRDLLTRWKMLAPSDSLEETQIRLGVRLFNSALESDDIARAVGDYAEQNCCDLLVLMTHESSWVRRIFRGSVAEAAARHAHAPALFLREGETGFVRKDIGRVRLNRVLMPVAADVPPMHAWGVGSKIVRMLEPLAQFQLIHVGDTLPTFGNLLPHVELRRGPVVETILEFAEQVRPDLLVMATAGHNELFDDLRGSTSERVLRQAPCPVLAIPSK
jgi:nucleotide-binding universal stress UspA family protein